MPQTQHDSWTFYSREALHVSIYDATSGIDLADAPFMIEQANAVGGAVL